MRQTKPAPRPGEWPRDDSWLFADPMTIGGEDLSSVEEAETGRDGLGPGDGPTPVPGWKAAFAVPGILAGVALGAGVVLFSADSGFGYPPAAACPQAHTSVPDSAVVSAEKAKALIHG